MEKLYYWAEGLDDYSADNISDFEKTIELSRLNFFIGKNNSGKSRFLRYFFTEKTLPSKKSPTNITSQITMILQKSENKFGNISRIRKENNTGQGNLMTPNIPLSQLISDAMNFQEITHIFTLNTEYLYKNTKKLSEYMFNDGFGSNIPIFGNETTEIQRTLSSFEFSQFKFSDKN